jgi:pyrimidine-nucleoside phosphorylase
LITASILSKKLAEGTGTLVLDIKVGNGAFMKSKDQARKLAKCMIQVGKKLGLACSAMLTDMSQPLGYAAGNSLEIIESIEVLKNQKGILSADTNSTDLKELTIQLCAQMLHASKVVKSTGEGRKLALKKLSDGSAYAKFLEMVKAQGGDLSQIESPLSLPLSKKTFVYRAPKKGHIAAMDTEKLGWLLVELGGGRRKVTDLVDFGVGFVFHKKLGARVQTGDAICTVYLPEKGLIQTEKMEKSLSETIHVSGTRKPVPKLIVEVIGK